MLTLSTLFDWACVENARAEVTSLVPHRQPFFFAKSLAADNTCVSVSVECECAAEMGGEMTSWVH